MARRGDGIYQRGKTWWMDVWINGVRYQKRLGKGITRRVALEVVQALRGKIVLGEYGIGKKRKDLPFEEARKKFEDWVRADKKPNTIRTYLTCLDPLEREFKEKCLSQITPWSLEAYKKRRGEGKQLTDRPADLSEREWN